MPRVIIQPGTHHDIAHPTTSIHSSWSLLSNTCHQIHTIQQSTGYWWCRRMDRTLEFDNQASDCSMASSSRLDIGGRSLGQGQVDHVSHHNVHSWLLLFSTCRWNCSSYVCWHVCFSHGKDNKLVVWKIPIDEEPTMSQVLPVDTSPEPRKQPWLLHVLEVNTLNFCSFAFCSAASKTGNQDEVLLAVPNTLTSEKVVWSQDIISSANT